jgi:peptidoglycan glycosyltransferase
MNGAILRLFGFFLILFALLVAWTSRWTVFDATALQHNPLNRREFLAQLTIKRGRLLARNGEVLARSVSEPGGTWSRTYPTGPLFAQAVGYSNAALGESAGLEQSQAAALRGAPSGITSIFGNFSNGPQVGNDVYTTLDPTAQRLAVSELAGRAGSVVALDPRTGAVLVLYSNPSYDNNHPNAPGSTQFFSALQSGFPPGSTFKVVTSTTALNSGLYTPLSLINGDSPILVSGVPLTNDYNQSWGPITLTRALTYSVNTVFAQVGERLMIDRMAAYMKRFGFYSVPPLDYPKNEMTASGERLNGRLLSPTSGLIDVGRMAIGQDKLAVSPMQMAMVASAVAGSGTLMTPHLVSKVVNPDGQVVQTVQPSVYHRVMRPAMAHQLAQMMTDVVEEGTGTAANLSGVKVAGKTGTAEIGPTGSNLTQPWFIGFAPVDQPRVAVAVTVDRTSGGFGGTVAAPIAAAIIKTLLAEGL